MRTKLKPIKFKKEIHTLRFSLTTKCTLACRYCFVKKDGRVYTLELAQKALNLFLSSPGKEKLLIIYGGEPFLIFDLFKKIVLFAKKTAKKNGKKLIISNGTNGTLLNSENLAFLRKEAVRLSISLDGKKAVHNKARIFEDGTGSFECVIKKVPLLLKNMKKQDVCVLFGILPEAVTQLFENFSYLISLGFDSINIEPIQSPLFKWTDAQKECFKLEMQKVAELVFASIKQGNFIFLNSINRELKDENISKLYSKALCPFYQNLEIYPDGEMAFSPFLINTPEKAKYLIGGVEAGVLEKYAQCQYEASTVKCQKCFNQYSQQSKSFGKNIADDVVKIRNVHSIYLARKIKELGRKEAIFAKYVQEAKKRIFE